MIRRGFGSGILLIVASGCSIAPCRTWEIIGPYANSEVFGMYICTVCIEDSHGDREKTIYRRAQELLITSGGEYSECVVVQGSLIEFSRKDRVFIRIDCSPKSEGL